MHLGRKRHIREERVLCRTWVQGLHSYFDGQSRTGLSCTNIPTMYVWFLFVSFSWIILMNFCNGSWEYICIVFMAHENMFLQCIHGLYWYWFHGSWEYIFAMYTWFIFVWFSWLMRICIYFVATYKKETVEFCVIKFLNATNVMRSLRHWSFA